MCVTGDGGNFSIMPIASHKLKKQKNKIRVSLAGSGHFLGLLISQKPRGTVSTGKTGEPEKKKKKSKRICDAAGS